MAVQLVVECAVEPGDPDQGEHRRVLAQPARREVNGQLTRGLGDQHDHDQVVEELQRADNAIRGLFAVGAGGLPQKAPQPDPPVVLRCLGGTTRH